MHVIVVGAGEVGSTIAASLADEHEVVVVDLDAERVDALTYSVDVLPLQGDGTDVDVLEEAGAADADMLIASTDDDETNIVTCGVAEAIGDPFTIARVKSPRYLRAWRRGKGVFDVDFMVCTDLLAAEAVVGIVGMSMAQDVDTFADGLVQMSEFEIPDGSPVAHQTVSEADRFDSLTFAAIIRGEEVLVPRGDAEILPGDRIVAIGSPESVEGFSSAIAPEAEEASDVVIAGGGEIGYQTATLLEERGFSPRLVERDEERARWLAEHLPGTTVINGDATDQELLERENVGLADVIVAALETDQGNLLATLLAKQTGTERAIAVVDSGDFAGLFEAVGIDVAVSPREATAEEIVRFTRARRAENVAIIEGDRAEVLELELDAESVLVGRPIREAVADLPEGVVVGAIARDGRLITPRGDTIAEVGDRAVVFADADALEDVAEKV